MTPRLLSRTPVGDFFGAGLCELASFASRYFGTSSGGFFCKWPMPLRQSFRVELENVDPELDTDVFCNVLYQLIDPLPEPACYFHAQFNTGPDFNDYVFDVGRHSLWAGKTITGIRLDPADGGSGGEFAVESIRALHNN